MRSGPGSILWTRYRYSLPAFYVHLNLSHDLIRNSVKGARTTIVQRNRALLQLPRTLFNQRLNFYSRAQSRFLAIETLLRLALSVASQMRTTTASVYRMRKLQVYVRLL
ncbi:hypothetical protein BU26DRAFT_299197 [Trematosphaeria pertusa]|uniref:Uncharacterized protein n=1 Tax=Trematosphaeria pertusa TaxID=390896 RepID=A0A6A6IJE1_9PLEO|nr:uncharacterized protein BU26DRAFT_299197 [Trematosphaeria pertusa]KAF2250297.1 hypothetical protein BU26DRAFT_299197 [Trematosphaeria pertusa]